MKCSRTLKTCTVNMRGKTYTIVTNKYEQSKESMLQGKHVPEINKMHFFCCCIRNFITLEIIGITGKQNVCYARVMS